MSTLTNDELLAELDRRRAELVGGGTPAAGPMQAPPMQPMQMPTAGPPMCAPGPVISPGGGGVRPMGLLVSITIPTPNGEVPCYLQLGSEAAANPQMAVQQLMQAGWPVKCWQPRQQQNGGGGWGGGGSGYQGGGRRWGGRY